MKKIHLVICLLITSFNITAQSVGIGTITPDASALLDIKSNNKGILVPRTSTISRLAILNPAKGLMLYDTTTSSFWFHNGTAWAQIGAAANGWALTGNAGTNPANNFLGTTDNLPLRFRLNNTSSGELNPITGNVYLGFKAAEQQTAGYSNVALGIAALRSNTSVSNLVAIGDSALYNNGTATTTTFEGIYNTAVGSKALYSNSTGSFNTAIGYKALYSNTTGEQNTAIGLHALFSNTIGTNNTANGANALHYNSIGNNNTANGDNALYFNTTANNNTAVGYSALSYQSFNNGGNVWESNNVAIGFEALTLNNPTSTSNGISNTAVGTYALRSNTIGFDNTALGASALYYNDEGEENTAIGRQALFSNTGGNRNTAIGYKALRFNQSGNRNTATGMEALYSNTTGNFNTADGSGALYLNSTASHNTAVGADALANQGFSNGGNFWSSNNVAVGDGSLYFNNPTSTINGINNTAIGTEALYNNTQGYFNTAIGYNALYSNTVGYYNTAIGYNALFNNAGDTYCNTAIGSYTLSNNISGAYNTAIGYGATTDLPSSNYNTLIGTYTHCSASNSVVIGYNSFTNTNNLALLGNPSTLFTGGYSNWSNFSDGRFKKDIDEDVKGLDFILRLRPVTYHMDVRGLYKFWGISPYGKEDSSTSAKYRHIIDDAITKKEAVNMSGFVAQEVEKAAIASNYDFDGVILPTHDKDHYRIAYAEFVVPLVKAVQELSEQTTAQKQLIEQQQNKIDLQQQQYETLLKRIEALEKKN
ncbi:MAG: tail fiber domain-containing protein [Ferruginibacter sp.]